MKIRKRIGIIIIIQIKDMICKICSENISCRRCRYRVPRSLMFGNAPSAHCCINDNGNVIITIVKVVAFYAKSYRIPFILIHGNHTIIKVREVIFIDFIGIDENENGKIEIKIYDTDKDGIFETYAFDLNEDGKIELYGLDVDGDGEIDKYIEP